MAELNNLVFVHGVAAMVVLYGGLILLSISPVRGALFIVGGVGVLVVVLSMLHRLPPTHPVMQWLTREW